MAHVPGNKEHLKDDSKYDDFDPDLDIDVPAGYEVVQKSLPGPSNHPTKPGTIKWFNSFAVQDQNGNEVDGVEYTVTMQKLPDGKELFIGPKQIQGSRMSDAGTNANGKRKIRFNLKIGDPPAGSYP